MPPVSTSTSPLNGIDSSGAPAPRPVLRLLVDELDRLPAGLGPAGTLSSRPPRGAGGAAAIEAEPPATIVDRAAARRPPIRPRRLPPPISCAPAPHPQ